MLRNPITSPIIGDSTMNSAILVTPAEITAAGPALAMAAPAYPPTSAWDDDDGRPHHQVSRFQMIAPIRPARISDGVTTAGSTIPLPMVLATCAPKIRKATKLKKPAIATAACGDSTRVLTTVAIELAASWKP